MLHRVFIAVNLPESVKTELLSYQEKWRDLPCRWTAKENLHITLVFLGNTSDTELQETSKILRTVALRHSPFSVEFSRISYGPSAKEPRMVWVEGVASKELLNLQKDLSKVLLRDSVSTLHLTLGRLKEMEFRRIDPTERPDVEEEISISVPVNSIEIMESQLKRGGAEYSTVSSFTLHAS
ncbi:MAG: 2'-5' RNA ligase [Parcubacteria group bacterium Greene0714_21]|nr:MAG: 2'-5' RNA ligase [Parcubacteria group bacterium Greene0416_39]TSC97772.1 MAG: 2'-5' RNA ligase [Parcubacteria group bacterium Greene1014_47]TSD04246.1 MAG: 2'-5' RNA ligase [Parcubacteria group bacterium Greene0714_21]